MDLVRNLAATLGVVIVMGCGYAPLRSQLQGSPHVRVMRARALVPGGAGAALAEEAERGARVELARYGALAEGDEVADRLVVEVVRVDERSEGVTSVAGEKGDKPLARGVSLRVTVRGEVEGRGEHYTTPDVDVVEVVAAPSSDALGWEGARSAAARSAARKGGALVAREMLGLP